MKAHNYTVYLINLFVFLSIIFLSGCHTPVVLKNAEITGYCGCKKCCEWERGRWKYLKLNFWNKYVSTGKRKGRPYSGKTASGTKPNEPCPGFFSTNSLKHPWMIPVRIIFFPWLFMPRDGTVAADTRHYPFGTRLYIPGYGNGVVRDRGGAIKGKKRFDIFFNSHQKALNWGRKKIDVKVIN